MINPIRRIIGKQPIIVLLVLGVLLLSGLINYKHHQITLKDAETWSLRDRSIGLNNYIQIAQTLGSMGKWDELEASLQYAMINNAVDFYSLESGGEIVWYGNRKNDPTKIIRNIRPITEGIFAYPGNGDGPVRAVALEIEGFKFSVGIEENNKLHQSEREMVRNTIFFEELLYFGIIVLVAGLWSLKDITSLVNRVRSGKLHEIGKQTSMSRESDLFIRGLAGYAQTVSDLEDENQRFGRQVLPSLKKEITSGKKPPYDFNCTMVRTDINNFSVIYNTHNVTEFMATINEFFHEISNVVARYNGLVHEFVGDEVIFYFKDDEHANSFAIALSAIRDINRVAERFHEATMESRGYPFTVKSSLAHGKVRFGPLVNGFSVAGSVLIETVRILSHIHEKDGNVVYYDGVFAPKLEGVVEGVERQRVMLKGFPEEKVLHQYVRHQELAFVLSNLTEKKAPLLTYFRSDFDLFVILKDLKSGTRTREPGVTLKAIQVVRQPYVAESKNNFDELLVSWANELETSVNDRSQVDAERLLSAVLMLFLNLVPKQSFSADASALMKRLLTSTDKRVAANALEILTHFEETVEKKITKTADKDDLRIAANALVFEGRDELHSTVVKKLSKMLNDKDASKVASALFAIGELAKTHRERDMVYYTTQIEFKRLVDSMDTYVQHANSMVRRQSMIAARKVQDAELLERTLAAVKLAHSDLVNEEATRYLGHYWTDFQISKAS